MAATNTRVWALPDDQRQLLEALLVDFDRCWAQGRLSARVSTLPPAGSPLALPALIEMIKIDLERQWQLGRPAGLEGYLQSYPELGTPETVPADLLQAEYEVRRQFGDAGALADLERRFPRRAEHLRRLLGQGPGAGGSSPAIPVPQATPMPQASTFQGGQPASAPGALPEQLGRYRILKCLGAGGIGSVYLAHDTQLDREVALKVPHLTPQDEPGLLERFYREARAAATLQHANLCPVYDVGQVGGVHYLTMAYVEGVSLAEAVKAGPLPQHRAAAVVRQVALALALAHRHGVIHRDLKPSNVMLRPDGEPVVMDFGLARRLNREDVRLTRSGMLLGSPAYMSPEQVEGDVQAMGPGCDIYSLGVILYELLAGRLPFQGSMATVLGLILTQEPARPSAYRPDLSPQLEAICMKALAKKAADRYRSMDELAEALRCYLHTAPTAVREEPRLVPDGREVTASRDTLPVPSPTVSAGGGPRRRPRWLWLAAGGAAALLLLATVIVIRTRKGDVKVEVPDDNPTILKDGKEIGGGPGAVPPQGAGDKPSSPETRAKDGKEIGGGPGAVPPQGAAEKPSWPKPSAKVEMLAKALSDEDGPTRRAAIDGLLKLKDPSSAPALARRVADPKWWGEPQLHVYGGPPSNCYDPALRDDALKLLRELAPSQVNPALRAALKCEEGRIRAWALRADLERIDRELWREEGRIRAWALRQLVDHRDRATVSDLTRFLSDEDGPPRRAAINGLLKLKDLSSVPALVRRVADPKWWGGPQLHVYGGPPASCYDPALRDDALKLLQQLAPDQVNPALRAALKCEEGRIRAWALRQLAEHKDKTLVSDLTRLIGDEYGPTRRAAIDGLLKLKDPSSVPALAQRVADPKWWGEPQLHVYGGPPSNCYDPALRDAALKLLRELAPKEVPPALETASKSRTGEVRAWALPKLIDAR